MSIHLTKEEKVRYARIIFNSEGREEREIDGLTLEQLDRMRSIFAQKIAYETVNGKIEALNEVPGYMPHGPRIPSLLTSLLCCFYPAENQDYFDITTSIFLKRCLSAILFWNNTFFDINHGKPEQYGLLWLIVTYTIVLGVASTLNSYFVEPANYVVQYETLLKCLGLVLIFKISQPLIYGSVIGCLGGFIASNQSLMLSSYALVLYFIPTIFCVAPSLYWHVLMLVAGGLFRIIFMFRNYETKLQSKGYILLFVMMIVEAIYIFITQRTMFYLDKGYGFTDGFYAVFPPNATDSNGKPATITVSSQHLLLNSTYTLRHYEI